MLPKALDLNLLRVFTAVHEAGSVSRAAEQLDMTQPAASAALARLRAVLGDPLFTRAGGAMQPTAKARRMAPGIGRALRELEASVVDETPFDPAAAVGHFTVASTDYTSMVILPSLVAELTARAPRIDLRVIGYDKDDVPALIDRGEIDLALGVFRTASGRAVRQRLCAERFVGLARRGHPRIDGGTIALDDYVAASHALVSMRRDARGEIDAALRALGHARRVVLTLPHMLALPDVLARSDLLAAVPGRVADAVAGDALQRFRLPVALAEWNIEMLWNAGQRNDPANRWLRETLRACTRAPAGRPRATAARPGPGAVVR